MLRRFLALSGACAALCVSALGQVPAPPGFLPVSQSNLLDANGNPLANATACAQVMIAGQPASVQAGGAGTVAFSQVCAPVINGAWTMNLPDMSKSVPRYADVNLQVTDDVSGNSLLAGYGHIQPRSIPPANVGGTFWCSSTACNLDLLPPNYPVSDVFVSSQGPKGDPGCVVGVGGCSGLANVATSGSASDIAAGTLSPRRLAFALRNPGFGGVAAGTSADGLTGGDGGLAETFYGDMLCTLTGGTYTVPSGFALASGHACLKQFVGPQNAGTAFQLSRPLQFAGGLQPQVSSGTVQARITYAPGSNTFAFVGFNAAPAGVANTSDSLRVGVAITPQGWVLDNQGSQTLFLPNAGTSSGTAGTTDSGFGNGWVAPVLGTYDVTLTIPGDGTIQVSMLQIGTSAYSYTFRFTGQTMPVCASPCGSIGGAAGIQNFEVDGTSASDTIANPSYSVGGPRAASYSIPHRPGYYNMAAGRRFPVAGNVWALLPWGYQNDKPNKFVIAMHGYAETGQMVQQQYKPVTDRLLQLGYVVLSVDNTLQNCYGNLQCVNDALNAIAAARSVLSLAPQGYGMADSMGGFQMLNLVSQGGLQLRALVGFCVNTNLAYAYNYGGASAAINAAYGIGSTTYSVATNGFDPQAVAVSGYGTQALQNSWLDRLTSVPMLLFASPQDTVVNKSQNADLFASAVNAAGGNVTVQAVTGDHESADHFRPAPVAAFFAQYN